MLDLEQRFAALRQEIDQLKAALQTTTGDLERHALHRRINECIRESIRLLDTRLEKQPTATRDTAADGNGSQPVERPLNRTT
jgi:hypothetical protein